MSLPAAAKHRLRARFDRIFKRRTGFAMLDRLLKRLHANKAELLAVLDRPEIPLHTNGSENDIRCQVTKRKISGGTRSDRGRDCRDAFLGLAKTCSKLGISFWDYLGARLEIPNHPVVPPLPSLVRLRCTAVGKTPEAASSRQTTFRQVIPNISTSENANSYAALRPGLSPLLPLRFVNHV